MTRHAAPSRVDARVRWGLKQAAGAAISTAATALVALAWHAFLDLGGQVDRLTDQIRLRPTPATSAQVEELTRAVHTLPTALPTPIVGGPVVIRPAGPGGVAVTVLPAPAAAPAATSGPVQPAPAPTPGYSPSPAPAATRAPCGLLGPLLGPCGPQTGRKGGQ